MSLYRVSGTLPWPSMSGNAVLAITNTSTTKLLVIQSLEVAPLLRRQVAQQYCLARLARVTGIASSAPSLSMASMDTNYSASGVTVGHSSAFAETTLMGNRYVLKNLLFTNGSNLSRHLNFGRPGYLRPHGLEYSAVDCSALEAMTVRAGEQAALTTTVVDRGLPLWINVWFTVGGHTYSTQHFLPVTTEQTTLWHIVNGGTDPVVIQKVQVSEVGDTSTPYFQVVPFTPALDRRDDAYYQVPILKYDTTAEDLTDYAAITLDVAGKPSGGIPEVALSGASIGTPQGVNYLHTRDFIGPSYAVFFPEMEAYAVGTRADTFGFHVARSNNRLIDPSGPLTIRPGETVGLVSSAELATGTTAVAVAGFTAFSFGCDIQTQDFIELTLTGLQNPSEVRIFNSGTTEEIAGQNDVTSGTFTAVLDTANYPVVDIAILSLGYQNLRYTGLTVGTGLNIPVVQQVDRQYQNQ